METDAGSISERENVYVCGEEENETVSVKLQPPVLLMFEVMVTPSESLAPVAVGTKLVNHVRVS
jgi:hypothetical protein